MSGPVSDEGTPIDLADLAAGHFAIALSDAEVKRLIGMGCALPFLPTPLAGEAPDPVEVDQALESYGLVQDGQLNPGFTSMWRAVSSPEIFVVVERVTGHGSFLWSYGVQGSTIVEQTRMTDGFIFVFASTLQLLGRILLVSGVLAKKAHDVMAVDPAGEYWAVNVVRSIPSDPDAPEPTEFRFEHHTDGSWSVDSRALTEFELAEALAGFVAPTGGRGLE